MHSRSFYHKQSDLINVLQKNAEK
jgi:hypothetical protein